MKNFIKHTVDRIRRKHLLDIPIGSKSSFTEVFLKNHGWQKLLSQGEYGTHEGLDGIYYLVSGFGKVHEKYCKRFR